MCALFESHTKSARAPVASELPELHTRTPTGNVFGPSAGLLESIPITSHVIRSTVSDAAPEAVDDAVTLNTTPPITATTRRRRRPDEVVEIPAAFEGTRRAIVHLRSS